MAANIWSGGVACAHLPKNAELAAAEGDDDRVARRLGVQPLVVLPLRLVSVAAADDEDVGQLAALHGAEDLVGDAEDGGVAVADGVSACGHCGVEGREARHLEGLVDDGGEVGASDVAGRVNAHLACSKQTLFSITSIAVLS